MIHLNQKKMKKKIKLIGIAGKAGSGKDTVATIIQFLTLDDEVFSKTNKDCLADLDHKGYCATNSKWEIRKFATALKKIVSILLGCKVKALEDREYKETPLGKEWVSIDVELTPRDILQQVGTDIGRNINQNVWVNALFNQITKKSRWIISDVRFHNEVQAIKDRGGLLIKVIRPSNNNTGLHISETALDNFDGFDEVIINDGSLYDLIDKVRLIIKKHKIK